MAFGTPFGGTAFSKLANLAARVMSLFDSYDGMILNLEPGNMTLWDNTTAFSDLMDNKLHTPAVAVFEKYSSSYGKKLLNLPWPKGIVGSF